MIEFSGTITIDGKEVKWERNPVIGGIVVYFEGFDLRMPGDPDEERIRCAIMGFRDGYSQGKHAGRRILQNDFRNLMDCQPR